MRASITAILVIRQGGEQLTESLRSLTTQTRLVSRLILVDSSAESTIGPHIEEALEGSGLSWTMCSVPYSSSFAEAIEEGMESAYGVDPAIPAKEWVWLLRDDSRASDSALEGLASAVDSAPLIKIAGPKQRMSDQPNVIREMGETMTRFGERITLAERELDQAQFDRLSDVLGVGEVGMLVHALTLRELGGLDPGLGPLDGGLDLCVRARLAGHRVVVVPRSILYVSASPADWSARKKLSPARGYFLARRAWLYRRLVYSPLWLLPALLLWIVPWAAFRALAQLLAKRLDRMALEPVAALAVLFQLGAIFRARQVLNSQRVTTWATIDSLRMPAPDVRKRKSIAREAVVARREERESRNPAPPILPSLPWLVLALSALSVAVFGRWWGASYLQGGGLVPLVEQQLGLWDYAWSQPGLDGSSVPADPAAMIFALLGSLLWWNPNTSVATLFVIAIPLAGAIAWWGFSQLLSKGWTTTVASFVWALSPPLLLALGDGRVGGVIALLALPWLLGALVTAHESWQRVGQASLATVIVTSSAPSTWPVVLLAVIAVSMVHSVRRPARMLGGVLPIVLGPSILLSFPRFLAWWDQVAGRWWDGWGVLFADPGYGVPFDQAPWWSLLLGWPEQPSSRVAEILGVSPHIMGILMFALGSLLIALGLLTLALAPARISLVFGILSASGFLSATIAPSLFSGFEGFSELFVWPGTSVGILLLGILVGAFAVLDRVDFYDTLGNRLPGLGPVAARVAGGAVIALTLVAPGVMAVNAWSGGTSVQTASAPRTLPAFVAAEASQSPQIGTLVMTRSEDSYLVTLERGAGATLMESSTLLRGRETALSDRDEDIARLAATLIRPSAANPSTLLDKYGVAFVLLRDDADSVAALALAQQPELVSASSSESGQLWQVRGAAPVSVTEEPESTGMLVPWFLGLVSVSAILAIPTERRARGVGRPVDDAVPALGEETADDL